MCYTPNVSNTPPKISSFNKTLESVLQEMAEGHYLFIVADLKKATIIFFNKGVVEKISEIMDPSVSRKIKSTSGEIYGRNTKLSHKINNQIHKHLQLIVNQASSLISGKHINGVFIGGHKTMFNAIEKVMPKELQEKVRGEFVTELNLPESELIAHCKQTLTEYLQQ
jgi:hypothetical protein